jgi:5'-3' exonuclease
MKELLEDDMTDEYEKKNIIMNMENLKKKFLYINKEQIKKVKELIRSFGMTYYDAPREADELCSLLVIKKKVWACLSEDMDMFVYGCSRVLRYFNLLNHNVVLYNTKSILRELGITQKQFRQICVLSGTDYYSEVTNISNTNNLNLNNTLILFKKYHKLKKDIDFYEWILMENKDYIKDYKLLNNIYNMFDLSQNENMQNFEKINIINTPIMKDNIRKILEEEGIKCK